MENNELQTRLNNRLKEYYEDNLFDVERSKAYPDFDSFRSKFFSEIETQSSIIKCLQKKDLFNGKVLILGVGIGRLERAIVTLNKNIQIFGFDPSLQATKLSDLARKASEMENILYFQGVAETLPFPDRTFDTIISNQVLEHVNNLENTTREIYRVLKHGGETYHFCPNYRSFFEGHYDIIWPPIRSKAILTLYLKLRNISSDLLEQELNLITPSITESYFKQAGFQQINPREYKKHLKEKLRSPNQINSKKLRRLFLILKKLRLIKPVEILITYFPFFPIFHVYAKKIDPGNHVS